MRLGWAQTSAQITNSQNRSQEPAQPLAITNEPAHEEETRKPSRRRAQANRRSASPQKSQPDSDAPSNNRSRTAKRTYQPPERTDSQKRMLDSGTSLFKNTDPATGVTTLSEVKQPGGQNEVTTLKTPMTIVGKMPPPKNPPMKQPPPLKDMLAVWGQQDLEADDLATLIAAHKTKIKKWETLHQTGGTTSSSSKVIALPAPPAKSGKKPAVITVPSNVNVNTLAAERPAPTIAAGQSTAVSARSAAAKKREAAKKEAKEDAELTEFMAGEDPEPPSGMEDEQFNAELSAEFEKTLHDDPDLKKGLEDAEMTDAAPEAEAAAGEQQEEDAHEDVFDDIEIMPQESAGKPAEEEALDGEVMASEQGVQDGGAEEEKGDVPADPLAELTEEERKILGK